MALIGCIAPCSEPRAIERHVNLRVPCRLLDAADLQVVRSGAGTIEERVVRSAAEAGDATLACRACPTS